MAGANLVEAREGILAQIRRGKDLIVPLLPKHVDFDHLGAQMDKYLRSNPRLIECSSSSIFWAFVHAAQVGLVVGDYFGEAYIIGYGKHGEPNAPKRAVFVPGYKGLIKLAYQSMLVNRIDAYVIYDRDVFQCDLGKERDRVHYVPYLGGEPPGKVLAVYTQIELATKAVKDAVMPLWRLEQVRERAPSNRDQGSAWHTDRNEMYRKTGLRHALKDAPKSTELDRALRLDEASEDEDGEVPEIPGFVEDAAASQGRAAKSRQRAQQQAAALPLGTPGGGAAGAAQPAQAQTAATQQGQQQTLAEEDPQFD